MVPLVRGTSGGVAGAKQVNGEEWEMKWEIKQGTLSGACFPL